MYCPKCRNENPDTAEFCNECGCEFRKAKPSAQENNQESESYTFSYLP